MEEIDWAKRIGVILCLVLPPPPTMSIESHFMPLLIFANRSKSTEVEWVHVNSMSFSFNVLVQELSEMNASGC